MDIHMGDLVRKRMRALGLGPTTLAKKIDTTKQNVYGIFKRKTLDTGLLFKLSLVLEADFFLYYSKELNLSNDQVILDPVEVRALKKDRLKLAETEVEVKALRKEVDLQHRIIHLLEEAKKDLEKRLADQN